MKILIKDATIITQDADRRVIRGDILIEEDRIAGISEGIVSQADEIINASGRIAMPGLVNAHTHLSMTLFRGHGEDLPLHRWLEERVWPIEAKQTAEDAGVSAMLSFCEMIRSGTTSFIDMCIHDTKHVFDAARKAGLRGMMAQAVIDYGDASTVEDNLKKARSALGYAGGGVKACIAAHAPNTCSEELLIRTKELARDNGLRYQLHVSETRREVFEVLKKTGRYPYEYLDSIGLMDGESIFAHGGWLTRREMELAGKRGISVPSCPVSNLKLATGGIAQITELDKAGANICLGTDSAASNNSLDMFETMKMASLLQRHHYWKADAIPTQKLLDFATIGGAAAGGFDCGSIEVGKLADIIILERGPNLRPGHDIIADIVYSAGPQNVRDVIAGGKPILRDKEIVAFDERQVLEQAEELGKAITRR